MHYSLYNVKTSIYRLITPKLPAGVFQVNKIPRVFQVSGNPGGM